MSKYPSTLLPQTNDPTEIQKSVIDLLKKINNVYDFFDGITTSVSTSLAKRGSIIRSQVLSGSPITLTTATPANIASIKLTAGVWQISGAVGYITAATTSVSEMAAGVSKTTATLSANYATPVGGEVSVRDKMTAFVPTATTLTQVIPTFCVTITEDTTLYLVARAGFTVAGIGAVGYIEAVNIK